MYTPEGKLLAILSRLSGRPPEKITPDMPLFGQGLGLDSLSGVDLLTALETEFAITLNDIDLHMTALDNVGSLLTLVHKATARSWANIIQEVAQAAHLQEGSSGVENTLVQIRQHPGATSRQLAAKCNLPTPCISALRKELVKAGLVEEAGKGALLTRQGQEITDGLYPQVLPTAGLPRQAYGRCANYPLFNELTAQLVPLLAKRPQANTALDQAKCLPETVAARALLALEYGAVSGRRIAFIGDDDYTSVGIAVLGKMLRAHGALGPIQLNVFDVDQRIVADLNSLASHYGWPLTAWEHDLRYPVPTHLVGSHDAFFTDPPYTTPGIKLFAWRGLTLCQPDNCTAFISFASKGPNEMLQAHQSLVEMGLLIREVLPGFNRYEGASLWGNQSQMLVFTGTSQIDPAVQETYDGPLYTADFRRLPH